MRKEYANYVVNLFVILISFLIIILTNFEYLFENIYLFFGLIYLIISIGLLVVIFLAKKDINRSIELSFKVVGGMIAFVVIEGILLGDYVVQNFVFLHWVNLIGGGMALTNSIKLKRIISSDNNTRVSNNLNSTNINNSYLDEYNNDNANYDSNVNIDNIDMSNDLYNDMNNDISYDLYNDMNQGVVLNGYINGVIFDDESQSYAVEISYVFNDIPYTFYVGGFDRDVSDVIYEKDLKNINVFLLNGSFDLVQIDEDTFRNVINN